jgi:Cu-processing system ATP-binding protein
VKIALGDVRKRFGRVTALDGITLTVPSGSRVGLIGPNGCGKSTLTRVLMGMLAAEGSVAIDGLSPFADRERLAQRLAYVPQSAPALAVDVGTLVRTVATVRGSSVTAIAARAHELGLDLAALADRTLRALSGGMKQRLMIALALAFDAELVVMDEPTAGLDVASRQRFYEMCHALPPTATVVLCSHRLEELQHLIDHVILLAEGRVAWSGTLDAFLARRASTVLELRATSEARTRWLRAHGFAPGTGAWWRKTMPRACKAEALAELLGELRGELTDLLVRDVETVDDAGGGGGSHAR